MPNEAVVHVVDDDLAVRQSLSFLLASDGLPVRLHESASAFLDNVQDASVGCVITDVRMPGIDGIEFIRRLKARGFTAPVIVMTGHADVPLAVEAMKEGAIDFIEKHKAKPFFLYLPFTVPHVALQVPEDSLEQYKGKLGEDPRVAWRSIPQLPFELAAVPHDWFQHLRLPVEQMSPPRRGFRAH